MTNAWLQLLLAIGAEVSGTLLLSLSDGFERPVPAVGSMGFYLVSFYFLSHAFRVLPAGIAYAVWSGLGTALVTLGSYAILRQDIGMRALAGIVLILAGVIVLKGGQA